MPGDENEARRARLKRAREGAGFKSARAAARAFEWAESTYRAHEEGGRNFGLETAEKYGAAFGVNGKWIWSDDGERSLRSLSQSLLPNAALRRENVRLPTRRLAVRGRAAGSPEGEIIMTGEAVDTVPCPAGLEDVPDAYAVYVVGDSMEPRYQAGEVVFVHPNKPYRRGSYVIVQINVDGEENPHGFIKQFIALSPTTLTLRQLNPDREIEFPRNKVLSIHRIVMSGDA